MEKRVWLKLAKAYVEDDLYYEELNDAIRAAADRHGICRDFIGLLFDGGNLADVTLEVLGNEFSYWFYECGKSFDKYNENTEVDGVHPNAKSLEDLYDLTEWKKRPLERRLECVSS